MTSTQFRFEALRRDHDRDSFSCGNADLDRYLKQQARQDQRRDVTRVFVAIDRELNRVAGYYSLSATSVVSGHLPQEVRRRLPHYTHTPAVLIGRLAVDERYQRQNLGRLLLMDALWRLVSVSEIAAAFAVIVDAKNEAAVSFYQRFGFITFPELPDRLFLPLATVRKLFE